MKIVIANGHYQADYIISMFKDNKKDLIVINSDKAYSEFLAKKYDISVYNGDPFKQYVLQEVGARGADIFIALSEKDEDNYVACYLAKTLFNVKKVICTVLNPNNVEVFKSLGIDSVISSTYLLAESIKNESALEDLVKTLSFENNTIVLAEIVVKSDAAIVGKKIMDINFPSTANISCIYRKPKVIIPNGKTIIRSRDKLIVACNASEQQTIIDFIKAN